MPIKMDLTHWLRQLRDYAPVFALLLPPLVALRALAVSYYRPEIAMAILSESTISNIAAVLILTTYPMLLTVLFLLAGPRLAFAIKDRRWDAVCGVGVLVLALLFLKSYSVVLGWINGIWWCISLIVMYFTTPKGPVESIENWTKKADAIMTNVEQLESQAKSSPPSPDLYHTNLVISGMRPQMEEVMARLARLRKANVRFIVMLGIGLSAMFALPITNYLAHSSS